VTQWLDIRRHADGAIDFDFYRRQAKRRRRLTRQRVFRQWLILTREGVKAIIRVFQRPAIGPAPEGSKERNALHRPKRTAHIQHAR
jgi:hypothetical protein